MYTLYTIMLAYINSFVGKIATWHIIHIIRIFYKIQELVIYSYIKGAARTEASVRTGKRSGRMT